MDKPANLKYKLQKWENYFIKDVYEHAKQHLDNLEIVGLEYSIVMYTKRDKCSPNYAWWFYFAQVNGTPVFKYRPYPDKKYIPDTIYIKDNSKLREVTGLVTRTINARINSLYIEKDLPPKEKRLKQSKELHESVFVPLTYENELFDKSHKDKIIERKLRKQKK